MSLADRRWLRLIVLCTFYVAQGIPWGFTAVTIPAYIKAHGVAPAAVASALAMTTLPYSFKWAFGPLIDAFTIPRWGRRRPWIVFAQLMMALTILSMILIPDLTIDLRMLAWAVLIHTVFNALQDVAVDALAVDLLSEDERGRANGFMYGSKYVGGAIGGFGMSWVIVHASLGTALITQTVILLAIMMVPLLVRETDKPVEARPQLRAVIRDLAEVFSVRAALVTGVLMLTINVALGMLIANGFGMFIEHLHWSQAKYTELTGGLLLGVGFGGAMIGGVLADYVGRRRLAAIASIVMASGWVVFGLATSLWTNDRFIYAMAILEALTSSMMTVTLFALCMDVSWARIGASQFAAYMAFANISTVIGFKLSGILGEYLDYTGLYLTAAAIQVAVTAALLGIDPKQVARTLPRADGAGVPRRGIVAVIGFAVVLLAMTIYTIRPLL